MKTRVIAAIVLTTSLSGLVACSATPSEVPSEAPTQTITQSASPSPTPEPLSDWTIAEVVGQLFMVGVNLNGADDSAAALIQHRHLGNIFLHGRSAAGVESVRAQVSSYTALVSPETTRNLPLLVAIDQEGGNVQAVTGPGFSEIPSAVTQSSMSPEALVSAATTWGAELAGAGINLNLAPVADLVDTGNPAANSPIGYWSRNYGHTPETVESGVRSFTQGMHASGVAVTLKHFPGMGRVTDNTDLVSGVTDTTTTADDPAIQVFSAGIDQGADLVMLSLAYYSQIDAAQPAVFSKAVATQLLRGKLGFTGVCITDDLSAAAQVQPWSPSDRAVNALDAGCDLILVSADSSVAPEMMDAVINQATQSPEFERQLRLSALRVLSLKEKLS